MNLSLADLNLIARSIPPFASNDRTGDQRVAVYVYRGHAWIETNGGPVGIEDDGAAELAAAAGTTIAALEQAVSDSAAAVCNAAAAARWADLVGMAEAEERFAADAAVAP